MDSKPRSQRTAPIIAIFGAPAAGKTYWRTRIAQHLDWPSTDIEDYGEPGSGRWIGLLNQLATVDTPIIVESCASPPDYRVMLSRCPSLVVLITASFDQRWARLGEREVTEVRARDLLINTVQPPRRPDLRVSSGVSAQSVLNQVQMRAQRLVCKTGRDTPQLAC